MPTSKVELLYAAIRRDCRRTSRRPRRAAHHGPEQLGVAPAPERGVEVDEVDPLGAALLPGERGVPGVAVTGLGAGRTLDEADGGTIGHIDGGKEREGHAAERTDHPPPPGSTRSCHPSSAAAVSATAAAVSASSSWVRSSASTAAARSWSPARNASSAR
jgi:hypothetical protein